ncbi:tetratricopeptide repeat protein [Methylomicrobium agile]|uniref:tetratricopeptide repeat protein n=1 Tax=Methylomicrobium agile TaxID=39774 RepID=UPI0014701747|nr:tetratricopeptide repeat protein [Methylomicrobium agile]
MLNLLVLCILIISGCTTETKNNIEITNHKVLQKEKHTCSIVVKQEGPIKIQDNIVRALVFVKNRDIKCLTDIASNGDQVAQLFLGDMYSSEENVERDYSKAAYWYRLSAEQGNSEAQQELGILYYKGVGVNKDYKESVKWYRLSAKQGHAFAQYCMGFMYYLGLGLDKDYTKSYLWLNLSASNGSNAGIELRDEIEKKIPMKKIIELHEETKICKSNNYIGCD